MSKLENPLLLKEQWSRKGAYSIVLKENDGDNNICDYYCSLIEQYSHKKVNTILEIYSEESLQIPLRKAGYEVTSIILDMQINAVGGEKDGDHFIVGKNFKFPNLKQTFDAVLITQGCFGKLVSEDKSTEFLSRLATITDQYSLLLFEFWHLPGIDKELTSEKGRKDWEKMQSATEGTIIRLTNSKLLLPSSLLAVDIHYIVENNNEIKQFNESHLWRLYTLSEINLLLSQQNFSNVKSFRFPTLEEPEFSSFRLLGIYEKNGSN